MKKILLLFLFPTILFAGGDLKDYQNASDFVYPNTNGKVIDSYVYLDRTGRGSIWYQKCTSSNDIWELQKDGSEKFLISLDTIKDQLPKDLAQKKGYFHKVKIKDGDIYFQLYKQQWKYSKEGKLTQVAPPKEEPVVYPPHNEKASPDNKFTLITQNKNLFLRNNNTKELVQITQDGTAMQPYAEMMPFPQDLLRDKGREINWINVTWSPDSQSFLFARYDKSQISHLGFTHSTPLQGEKPLTVKYPYGMATDKNLPHSQYFIGRIDGSFKEVTGHTQVMYSLFSTGPLGWDLKNKKLYLHSFKRAFKEISLTAIDLETAKAQKIIIESDKQYVSNWGTRFVLLADKEEVLVTSERNGYKQLYLHNSISGQLIHRLTPGELVVLHIVHRDDKTRMLYFTASAINSDIDPYYASLCSVNLDKGLSSFKVLTPEPHHHRVALMPELGVFIDSYSRANIPTTHCLRSIEDGRILKVLSKANWNQYKEKGYALPEPFKAKARDGKTDIYGLIWRPPNLDPTKKYPIIEEIYNGPHGSFTPKHFDAIVYRQQALANLGFIVIQCDAMGTGNRSKEFQKVSYMNLGDGGFPDRMRFIKAINKAYPYADINRVGIYGHSAGGYDSTRALIAHPEFYKVAVSSAGNHDHRLDKASWVEQWMGSEDGPHYDEQSNIKQAAKLQGKLLLVHGEIDYNVNPAVSKKLYAALQKEGKDVELRILPNKTHNLINKEFQKMKWDFFVRHLLGKNPPEGFQIEGPGENDEFK